VRFTLRSRYFSERDPVFRQIKKRLINLSADYSARAKRLRDIPFRFSRYARSINILKTL